MKQKILMVIMIILSLSIPLGANAKNKPEPANVVLLKDANGVEIGRVIGMEHVSRPFVLTDQGYRTDIPLPRGWIGLKEGAIYYESTDCTGAPYVNSPRYVGTVFTPSLVEDAAYELGMILYIPHDTQSVTVNVNSVFNTWWDPLNPSCDPFVETREGYPAYPNDPTITGIKNTLYPTPMVIE